MFSRFERFLKPTATPERPEPPAGLLGFLWHFARQAKPLFIALFVVEFFVGADRRGRSLVHGADRHLSCRKFRPIASWPRPGRGWSACCWSSWSRGRRVALARYLIANQAIAAPFSSLIRWQAHWHVVRQSWSFFQNDFAGRISNRVMQTGPAVRQTLVTSVTAVWYVLVYGITAVVMTAVGRRLARGRRSSAGSSATSRCYGTSFRASATAPRSIPRRARR